MKYSLKKHVALVHETKKYYKCDICKYGSSIESDVNQNSKQNKSS